jgi:hypothetical protein
MVHLSEMGEELDNQNGAGWMRQPKEERPQKMMITLPPAEE